MSLLNIVQAHLADRKSIPFAEFMHLALYAPEEGYYNSSLPKLGSAGDFTTAPELTPLFGYTIANQCQQILATLDNPILFEFGAGSGKLCVDILEHLETRDCLPESYRILEVSANLRQRQQEYIQTRVPHLASKVHWIEEWPKTPFNGIIIANEVLDAMPVNKFMLTEEAILEGFVTLDEHSQLVERFKPCDNQRLIDYLQKQSIPKPYVSEVNLFLNDWIANVYEMLHQGVVLLIDYGFPRHEYYHPDRHQGTLMCHYKHHSHPNALLHPGEQDITAHVDFTHVAEAAHEAGFTIAGYTNQASFLLANGVLELLANQMSSAKALAAQQAVKQLIQHSDMGELFKVIALSKHMEIDLQGFQLHDKRASL